MVDEVGIGESTHLLRVYVEPPQLLNSSAGAHTLGTKTKGKGKQRKLVRNNDRELNWGVIHGRRRLWR